MAGKYIDKWARPLESQVALVLRSANIHHERGLCDSANDGREATMGLLPQWLGGVPCRLGL